MKRRMPGIRGEGSSEENGVVRKRCLQDHLNKK